MQKTRPEDFASGETNVNSLFSSIPVCVPDHPFATKPTQIQLGRGHMCVPYYLRVLQGYAFAHSH